MKPAGMPNAEVASAVATYDSRPYFARALDFGLKNGIIDSEKLEAIDRKSVV